MRSEAALLLDRSRSFVFPFPHHHHHLLPGSLICIHHFPEFFFFPPSETGNAISVGITLTETKTTKTPNEKEKRFQSIA
jgi:hypothetical protein